MTDPTPKIAIHGVKKAFGPKVVLDGVDLDVMPGESVVVVGGSGTGKSVLIKCVLGILEADSGSIRIDGVEARGASPEVRGQLIRKMGMLFQGGALFDSLPVWENVAFGLIEAQGMPRKQAKPIAIETLRKVGLADRVANLYPAELSGGMQKRVSLARAIATSPEIIFFDEPTTGLDPIMADVINRLILERVKELGATALTITHDMGSVRKIADRVAMLHEGRIVWQGPVADIDTTDNPFVQQFVFGREDGPIKIGG